ncbi:protein of unknown function DUF421 [Thermobaculum terrenum ATCC BAA-798]|uniref:DUF421 domain-containing protein n=1 Tax=Thermobaculum terrenum (strain ATCC BAA-798 / CCMEE 7001 / YNP1) TaxID=525904 RepID=D1CDW4_THET1|nr:YetF domain-containing protein [Thermobaculum terrenum]ACZ41120.1 protein of unknown function DUF421 [Thermobaculum terrenum ATCC BAA-798]
MDIVIRATVIFWGLYILIRLLGKRELAQMTPFELIVLVVMGDLIQQGITHNDFSLTGALIAITTFGFWAASISWATYLSRRFEQFFDGKPIVIVRDGRYIEPNMRNARVTRSEVESEMRLAGIANISNVAWAIIEPKGRISFIQSQGDQQSQQSQSEEDMAGTM